MNSHLANEHLALATGSQLAGPKLPPKWQAADAIIVLLQELTLALATSGWNTSYVNAPLTSSS